MSNFILPLENTSFSGDCCKIHNSVLGAIDTGLHLQYNKQLG